VLDDWRRKAMSAIREMGHARTLSYQLVPGDPVAVTMPAGVRPPTPATKRFADSVARQKGIRPQASSRLQEIRNDLPGRPRPHLPRRDASRRRKLTGSLCPREDERKQHGSDAIVEKAFAFHE
jgi:hypothetical protein